jgi:hypothetical protein
MGNSAAMREIKGLAPPLPGLKYGAKRVVMKGAPKVPQHIRAAVAARGAKRG